MTIERRLVAGIEDIKGVCFECLNPKCGVRHTFAPDKIGEIPLICPHCRETWITSRPGGREVPAASPFVNLVEAIARVRALLGTEGVTFNFRVLLEFEPPPE